MALGDDPVLDADQLARSPIGPAGRVAGGEDAGRGGLEILADDDSLLDGEAGRLRQGRRRPHADADDDEVRVESGAAA